MLNNILVLCLGNICRSPMAEGLLKKRLPNKNIFSAGLRGMTGWTADPFSIQVMQENGIDISNHRAKNLTKQMVENADLILTMEKHQVDIVESRFPESKGKVMRLGEYNNYDITDPFNKNLTFFRKTYELIEKSIDLLISNNPHLTD